MEGRRVVTSRNGEQGSGELRYKFTVKEVGEETITLVRVKVQIRSGKRRAREGEEIGKDFLPLPQLISP